MQEQLGISKEAGVSNRQIAQQAMNEHGKKTFEIFRQGEEEVCIASLARWNAQLKGLAELEKGVNMWCRETEKYYEQIFEELKEQRPCYLCRKALFVEKSE